MSNPYCHATLAEWRKYLIQEIKQKDMSQEQINFLESLSLDVAKYVHEAIDRAECFQSEHWQEQVPHIKALAFDLLSLTCWEAFDHMQNDDFVGGNLDGSK